MPWVRIHDAAMTSLKILKLTDSAFRLWVKGLAYCQLQLTDGLIPREALREMGAKRKDVDLLSTALVADKAPLWEPVPEFGFLVHDYLAWNDSKEKVSQKRSEARERMENSRRSSRELLRGVVLPPEVGSLEKRNTENSEDDGFVAFWSVYPKKDSKKAAVASWRKLHPDSGLVAIILSAVERQRQSESWLKDGGRFIPMPATWLNNQRWLDEGTSIATPLVSETTAYNLAATDEAERLILEQEAARGHRR